MEEKEKENIRIYYPEEEEIKLQELLYKKRELYKNKVPELQNITEYEDIKVYRENRCGNTVQQLRTHQALLSNLINPETPYKGLLLCHEPGTGKTCAAYAIAENFKEMVLKYGTKIHILLSGPLLKEQWKNQLIMVCARKEYLNNITDEEFMNMDDKTKKELLAKARMEVSKYYRIMSYSTFQKKVIGQKISNLRKTIVDRNYEKKYEENEDDVESEEDKKEKKDMIKKMGKYKKNIDGTYERDVSIDNMETLDNTLLIVDEAHSFTGNDRGESLKKIIDNSTNLKVLLLTATPMKNLADDIVELINYLKPKDKQIDRDIIFKNVGSELEFKPDGKDYLRKMISGYVSYIRGSDPLTFAEREDEGELIDDLIYTKVTRCYMEDFQLKAYEEYVNSTVDALDRGSQSYSNFVYPLLIETNKSQNMKGVSGEEGLNMVIGQLKTNKRMLVKNVKEVLMKDINENEINNIMSIDMVNKSIRGLIYKKKYLKNFSTKFYECLENINKTYDKEGLKGAQPIFVYSNLVRLGVNVFKEVLLNNGYLEFVENGEYNIMDDTLDSITGEPYSSYNEEEKKNFHPATFMILSGSLEGEDKEPEILFNILNRNFNASKNKYGKYLKIIVGSKVTNEGLTLKNVGEVHILDVYYTYGKILQVIGRAIRSCVHYDLMSDVNRYPKVKIYKYVASNKDNKTLMSDEELYKKAEIKYILIKEVERIMKESAIDCMLNYNANVYKNEIDEYKDCVPIREYMYMDKKEREKRMMCPEKCDFQKCEYKCNCTKNKDDKLYDEERKRYRELNNEEIDYSTFTTTLKRSEINYIMEKIKILYRYKNVYTLKEIIEGIRRIYEEEMIILFDEKFVLNALDKLIPITDNDFNIFKDVVYNKYNIAGYIIYRGQYYIFQPFEQSEDVSLWYRDKNDINLNNPIKLDIFLDKMNVLTNEQREKIMYEKMEYDFSNIEYYNSKEENEYIGIIDVDKSLTDRNKVVDIFKIKNKNIEVRGKKRGYGISNFKGMVCHTGKHVEELIKIAKEIGIIIKENDDTINKYNLCKLIRNRLLYLEKYNDDNKLYVIVPSNHKTINFPFNLKDRIENIINKIKNVLLVKLDYTVKKMQDGVFEGIRKKEYIRYKITINNKIEDLNNYIELLKTNGFYIENNLWICIIE